MDLKELLGEELYNQVVEKAGDNKLAVVSDGSYIPKQKFDEKLSEKTSKLEELEGSMAEKDREINVLKERVPKDETPDQKELRELREQFDSERKERTREQMRNKAFSLADEKGLPKDPDILDRFLGEDEDSTLKNLEALEQSWTKHTTKIKDDLFKQNGREIGGGEGANLSPAERIAQQNNQQKETPKSDLWNQEGGS